MIIERILARSAGVIREIQRHPFNQQLYQGTLPRDKFISFLKQDAEYLRGFSHALDLLSRRFDNNRLLAQRCRWFSTEMIDSEKKLQSRYLYESGSPTFFSTPYRVTPKIPAIQYYTTYQAQMAQHAPIEEAVSCLSSCYWIYHQLGQQMKIDNLDTNPYQRWITSYSSKQFTIATQLMIETLHDLGSPITCEKSQEKMIVSFYQSAQYELMFYDAILPRVNPQGAVMPMDLKIYETPVLIKGTLRYYVAYQHSYGLSHGTVADATQFNVTS